MRTNVAALAFCLALAGAAAPQRFSIAAMQQLVSVSGAVIAPDGTEIAYVTSRNVLDRNTSVDTLHVYDLRNRSDRVAAFAHESYSDLQWSSDGRLAFVADDDPTKHEQLFVTDAALGSERRITSGTTGVLEIAWRRDNGGFAFLRRDSVPEKHGADRYRDAFEVGDNAYLTTDPPASAHLWTVALDGRERRVTSGSWSIRDSTISWSGDDRYVLYERVPSAVYGVRDRSVLERVDTASGNRTALTGHPASEDQGAYAPDGSAIALLYPRDGVPQNESEVYRTGVTGGETVGITRSLDRHVEDFAWYDARHVLARVYDRTQTRLYVAGLNGEARALPTGNVAGVDALDPLQSADRNGDVVFTGSTPGHPGELYYLQHGAQAPVVLTHLNDAVEQLALGRESEISWHNGGFTEYGVLTYPPEYDPRKRYPLLIRIHGGPTETSLHAFEPFYQLAAARGYVVLAPNYRGSSSNGNRFEHAIFNDASAGPGSDVIAAVSAVKHLNIIDPNRIGVSGWSYGGQMTTWMISHYHVWKAAVVGAGVNDLVVDYAIADDYDDDLHAFSGPPRVGRDPALWERQSPITYVNRITTPTLILCNVYDVRVPIVESYELYHALRDRGVPVKFYAYPTTGHLPHGPVRLGDAYEKWIDWMDDHLHP